MTPKNNFEIRWPLTIWSKKPLHFENLIKPGILDSRIDERQAKYVGGHKINSNQNFNSYLCTSNWLN